VSTAAPPPEGEPTDPAATPPGEPGPARDGARPEPAQHEVDAAFAALVAGWDAPGPDRASPAPAAVAPRRVEPPPPRPPVPPDPEPELEEDEGHYEPPEPPALPRLSVRALGGLVLLLAGAVLLVSPGALGLTDGVGFPVGLLVVVAGLGVLLSRLRAGPDPDSGWDDGARL
jgi:hypothetical protein